jgi:hypothetical protein
VQQDRIDHATNHRRRSDAQCQGQSGENRKADVLPQHPKAEAKVVPKAHHLYTTKTKGVIDFYIP